MQPTTASELAEITRMQAEQFCQLDLFATLKNVELKIGSSPKRKAPTPEQAAFAFIAREDKRIVKRGGTRARAGAADIRRELAAAYKPER